MLDEPADHLCKASGLPELLAASFQAFEDIRMAARRCEDLVPELLATFMTAADAAIRGREAIASAPSLTRSVAARSSGCISTDGDVLKAIDALASQASLLSRRLADGVAIATVADDRTACIEAAAAARHISTLMARNDNDRHPG